MAKLSARGRRELARYEKTETRSERLSPHYSETKRTYAFMSDGTVLRKYSWRYASTLPVVGGQLQDSGWKVRSKYRVESFSGFQSQLKEYGYTEVQK